MIASSSSRADLAVRLGESILSPDEIKHAAFLKPSGHALRRQPMHNQMSEFVPERRIEDVLPIEQFKRL